MKRQVLFISWFLMLLVLNMAAQETEKKILKMSLQDVITQALKNNLDLQIEMTNPDLALQSLKSIDSMFIPKLGITADKSESNYPATDILSGAEINKYKSQNLNFSLSQKLALGGTLEARLNTRKSMTNSSFSTLNPSLDSQIQFQLSQPVLKGFGTLATKKNIYIYTNNYEKSLFQLKSGIINAIFNVESAYWELVYYYLDLEAKKKALQQSQDWMKQTQKKIEVGILAAIDLLDAQADVASKESQLLAAEQALELAQENLKKILNISQIEEEILPTDKPETEPVTVDYNQFLEEALANRPEIEQSKLELKNYQIEVKYARNQMLPDLQLVAYYYSSGRGGDKKIFAPGSNPFDPNREVIGIIKKDIWDTLKDSVSNLYRNYSISLNLTVPLSFRAEKAQLAQAEIGMKKALLTLKNTENTILSEVKQLIKEIEYYKKFVAANELSVKREEEKLKAEQKKLAVGLSTNYDVLIKQRDFIQSQSNYLQSLKGFRTTIAKLNKILGRTFKTYQIKFADFVRN